MKPLLLYSIICLSSLVSLGQNNYDTAYVLHYDFLNGRLHVPTHMNWHPSVYRPFIVQIDSINRGAFKIQIKARDSILATSDPTQFTTAFNQLQQVKPKVGDTTGSENSLKAIANASANATPVQPKKGSTTAQTAQADAKQTNTAFAAKNLFADASNSNISEFTKSVMNNESTDSLMLKNKPSFNGTLTVGNIPDTSLRSITYNNLYRLFNKLRFTRYALLNIADSISYSITDIDRSMLALKHHFMTKSRFENNYKTNEDTLRRQLLRVKKLYSLVPGITNDLAAWQETSKGFFNDTFFRRIDSAALITVQQIYNSIHADSLLNALSNINLALSYLGSDEFYRYSSPPITPFGDMIIVDVAIQAIDKKDSTQPDDAKVYELKLFTKNRFRFDFSTGLGTLFNLSDKSYHLAAIGTDSVNISENPASQKITPMIAAFLHAGYDIGSSFKPAVTLGLSINASTLDLTTVLLGISGMFGRDDKLILTGGWAMKKINVLTSNFKTGVNYATTNVGSTVPTESIFRSGWFLSFSYNLTNKPSQK